MEIEKVIETLENAILLYEFAASQTRMMDRWDFQKDMEVLEYLLNLYKGE